MLEARRFPIASPKLYSDPMEQVLATMERSGAVSYLSEALSKDLNGAGIFATQCFPAATRSLPSTGEAFREAANFIRKGST